MPEVGAVAESVVSRVAALAAVVSAGALGASSVHNFLYFSIIDPSLLRIMTINDYLSGLLYWLPPLAVVSLPIFLFVPPDAVIGPADGPNSAAGSSTTIPPHILQQARYAFWATLGLMVFVLIATTYDVLYGRLSGWYHTPGVAIIIILGLILRATWRIRRLERQEGDILSRLMRMLGPYALLILIMMYYVINYSVNLATGDLREKVGLSDVVMGDDESIDNMILLKSMEAGYVIRDPRSSAILIVPHGNIKKITNKKFPLSPQPRICRWFGWGCTVTVQEP